jgi:dTMP kinase
MTGRLITFEGIDGAGKSTHLPRCAELLRQRGCDVLVTREPGGTELAEQIRDWFLHRDTDPDTEVLLAFASRSDHLARVIRPALAAGRWVVCDRFTDSTVAYQGGGRQLGAARVERLEHWLHPDLQPDRTYLFDLEPEEAARRPTPAGSRARGGRDGYRARAAAAAAAAGEAGRGRGPRILTIDASQDPGSTWKVLQEDLLSRCKEWSS